jgi:hypothetical protein
MSYDRPPLDVPMHEALGPNALRGKTYPRVSGTRPAFQADDAFPAMSRDSELAAELLDVVNESELDEFVGGLVAEAAWNAGRRIPVETGRALASELRKTVERTLPTLTIALDHERRPGATAGPATADTAARVFGVELEGMSAEDRDFEIARRFVRFAHEATVRAATASAPDPATAARDAVAKAGRELAPGLLPPPNGRGDGVVTPTSQQATRGPAPEVAHVRDEHADGGVRRPWPRRGGVLRRG